MLRKRKPGPRKATAPLSQKAAQLQAEEGSLLDDAAKAAIARLHEEAKGERGLASEHQGPSASSRVLKSQTPSAFAGESSDEGLVHGRDQEQGRGAARGDSPGRQSQDGPTSRADGGSLDLFRGREGADVQAGAFGEIARKDSSDADAKQGSSKEAASADSQEEGASPVSAATAPVEASSAEGGAAADGDAASDKDGALADKEAASSQEPSAAAQGEGASQQEEGVAKEEDAAHSEKAADAEGAAKANPAKKRKPLSKKGVVLAVAGAVVAVVVLCFALFSWDRWLRYDDMQDLQGQWVVEGGTGVVSIDGELIHLTERDAYAYTVDPGAKTLTFTFGDLTGDARYRFSADRTQLAIQDGVFGPVGTFFDDLAWALSCIGGTITGQPASPSFGEGSIVLGRAINGQGQTGQGDSSEEGSSGDGQDGSGEDVSGESSAEDQAAAEAEAQKQAAAEEEKRQEELRIQEALGEGGSSVGEVGANAVSPEDLQ